ncbi:MAG: hypothetical protein B6244_13105 [Candidatus Cloacimonetes bacterium 4572_55]|nr:MAG: hypothetical protein B6244_13105 [Candidatus Cloacimonetes bacterium 4572_55]
MNQIYQNINIGVLAEYITWGVIIYLVFRALYDVVGKLSKKAPYLKKIRKVLPAMEIIAWMIFLIAILPIHENENLYALYVILTLTLLGLWSARFAISDFIAGLILHLDDDFSPDDYIQIRDIQGRITRFGYRTLDILTDNKETVKFPYSRLTGQPIVKMERPEKWEPHTFLLELPRQETVGKLIDCIKTTALNAPWSVIPKKPVILKQSDTESSHIFKVSVYALSPHYAPLIEDYIRGQF